MEALIHKAQMLISETPVTSELLKERLGHAESLTKEIEELTGELKQKFETNSKNSIKEAAAPFEKEAQKYSNLLTRPKAVWDKMGWKGKTAIGVGVGAAVVGTALATGYLINRWRNSGEPENNQRLSHVQSNNYKKIDTQLDGTQRSAGD